MRRLSVELKLFIVQELACFRSPKEVGEAVQVAFEVEVTPSHIQFFDPTKRPENKKLPQKWKDIFWATRQEYLEQTAAVPVAHKRYRLEVINEVLQRQRAKQIKNDPLILETTEQAAKEMGGMFTNKRELSGPNGGAIPLSVEDKRKELAAQMLQKLVDKGKTDKEARATLITMGVNESDLPAIQTS